MPDRTETVVSNSSAIVISAVASSAMRGSMIAAVPPTGRISSVARPLATPPLAWISSTIAIASIECWNSACHSTDGKRRWIAWMQIRPNVK